jgi:hypothetical protein
MEHYLKGPGGEPPPHELDYSEPDGDGEETEPLRGLGYVGGSDSR